MQQLSPICDSIPTWLEMINICLNACMAIMGTGLKRFVPRGQHRPPGSRYNRNPSRHNCINSGTWKAKRAQGRLHPRAQGRVQKVGKIRSKTLSFTVEARMGERFAQTGDSGSSLWSHSANEKKDRNGQKSRPWVTRPRAPGRNRTPLFP